MKPPPKPHCHAPHCPPAQTFRRAPCDRLNVVHHNVGGLSTYKLEEIKEWARCVEADILILTETHWSFHSDWSDLHWHHIHVGAATERAAGLLILLRHKVCPADRIGLASLMDGRLLHIRLHYATRAFDLLCCYQYADDRSVDRHAQRAQFWTCLDDYIGHLPRRNQFLLVGDLNCSLRQDGHHVGTSFCKWRGRHHLGPQHRDRPALQQMLRRHDLTVLNSWDATAPPTFESSFSASRIDFFIMRYADVDALNRDITHFGAAPIVQMTGARHIPLMCSIRKYCRFFVPSRIIPGCTYRQRLACRIASKQQLDPWHTVMNTMAEQVQSLRITSQPDDSHLVNFHAALIPVMHDLFARVNQPVVPRALFPTMLLHDKWYHHRCLKACKGFTRSQLFAAWFHWTSFRKLARAHKQHAKQTRRQRLNDLMHDVQCAAARHDSFEVSQIIARYSPKQPKKPIRLRMPDGQPASPDDSLRMMTQFVRTLWAGPDTLLFEDTHPVGVPFSVEALEWEIRHMPSTKSVARPFLPTILLKQHSQGLAEWLFAQLQMWWSTTPTYVPSTWKQGWLTFIGKPGKNPDKLDHLRPLALQEPLGKCVLGVLTRQFSTCIAPLLQRRPQFAFLKMRSASDAIHRVMQHCAATRTLIANQRRSVHQRASQVPSFAVCGGLQVFLDLRKAFDVLPRQRLFDYLSRLDIDQRLVRILAAWHNETSYVLFHADGYHAIPTGRGVRQGCRVAPILWAAYMNLMFDLLANEITDEWVRDTLTLFADDLHHGTQFFSEFQLREALAHIGLLMDTLENLGLQISYEKTIIVLQIAGSNARRVKASVLKRDSTGFYVEIPRGDGTISKLPVQNSASYLGVCASYSMFEMQSLRKRIQCAHATFHRLRCWLRSRSIALKFRLQLWHTCVFTTMTYGLHAVGWTMPGLKLLHQTIIRMLRIICRDHSYLTGHTHRQFLHAHRIDQPLRRLLQSAVQLQANHAQRRLFLEPDDIVLKLNWALHSQSIQLIQTAVDLLDQEPVMSAPSGSALPRDEAFFQCPQCALSFTSLPNLRRHLTHVHHSPQFRTHFCTAAAHALNGLPQCSTCYMSFTSWRAFQIHLERRCCEALGSTTSMSLTAPPSGLNEAHLELLNQKPYGAALLSAVRRKAWEELLEFALALKDLKQSCVICGIFHNRPQELNQHLRVHHPTLVPNVFTKTVQLCRAHACISPCRFCGKEFMRSHMCPVLTQAALLCVNLPTTQPATGPSRSPVLFCEICHLGFEDLAELHAHLRSTHRLELQDWVPSRDLQGSDPVCAHCQACFTSKAAVRQHICQGQCPQFDPSRAPYQQTVQARWEELLLTGNVHMLTQQPTARLHLTLKCQLCSASFDRQMDLSLHLQTVHAREWMHSQPYMQLHMLINFPTIGCLCNPSPNTRSLTHACPAYRQLSMLALRLHEELLIPWPMPANTVSLSLNALANHPGHAILVQSLVGRQFQQLWQDELCCDALSTQCSLCGGTFPVEVLREHLLRAHPSVLTSIDELMPLLLPCYKRQLHQNHQCPACGMIFNLPRTDTISDDAQQRRLVQAQNHCRYQCPVFAQIASLLGHGRLRPRDAGSQRRPATARDLQADEQVPPEPSGPKRRRRAAPQKSQTGPTSFVNDDAPGPETGSAVGPTGGSSGHGKPDAAKARLFHLLHANAEGRNLAHSAHDSEGLAQQSDQSQRRGEEQITISPSATGAGPDHGASPGLSVTEDCTEPGHGSALDHSHQTWHADGAGTLALSTVESHHTDPGNYNSGTGVNGPHAEVHRAAEVAGDHPGSHHEVPQPTTSRPGLYNSLVATDRSSPGRTSSSHGGPHWQQYMGTPGHERQAPHVSDESAGTEDSGAPGQGQQRSQGQEQGSQALTQLGLAMLSRDRFHHLLSKMVLHNPSNSCFANSGLIAAMWATLSHDLWTSDAWGPGSSALQHLLVRSEHTPCNLALFSWFSDLMRNWTGSDDQGDPVEFTAHLLRGLQFRGFDFTWERRVQIGDVVECHDVGCVHTPLTFQLDPDMVSDDMIQLRHLVTNWVHQDGMFCALRTSTPLLCIHVDRFVHSPSGQICKSAIPVCFHGAIDIPIWQSAQFDITWKPYQWVAAMAHLGQDNAGHVRAILKVAPDGRDADNPVRALLTEDGQPPERIDLAPHWFKQNLCCVWLCDCDHIELLELSLPPGAVHFAHRPCMQDAAPTAQAVAPDLLRLINT